MEKLLKCPKCGGEMSEEYLTQIVSDGYDYFIPNHAKHEFIAYPECESCGAKLEFDAKVSVEFENMRLRDKA